MLIVKKYKTGSIEEEVLEFMDNHMHVYVNQNNVEIVMNADQSFIVGSELEDEITDQDDISLEVVWESDTIGKFIDEFGITSAGSIKDIIPAYLMSLYYEGRAKVCCFIDGYLTYNLNFSIQENSMMAVDDSDEEHEVPVLLETPEQFIDYTRRYFQIQLDSNKIKKSV